MKIRNQFDLSTWELKFFFNSWKFKCCYFPIFIFFCKFYWTYVTNVSFFSLSFECLIDIIHLYMPVHILDVSIVMFSVLLICYLICPLHLLFQFLCFSFFQSYLVIFKILVSYLTISVSMLSLVPFNYF